MGTSSPEAVSPVFVESCEDLTYPLAYPNHYIGGGLRLAPVSRGRRPTYLLSKATLVSYWNRMIVTNSISRAWIFYIAYLYQDLGVLDSINLYQGLAEGP